MVHTALILKIKGLTGVTYQIDRSYFKNRHSYGLFMSQCHFAMHGRSIYS
jgi:hypothetical protein